MKEENRIVYFAALNILAIISVIAMHVNGIVHVNPNIRAWNTALIVDCICYFAVPVFIMLSGANLISYRKKYDTKTFFKKRAEHVLIPFLFWSVVVFFWDMLTNQISISGGVRAYLSAFMENKEMFIYYFMFGILGLYLTIPLLSIIAKKKNYKILWLTCILYFVFNGLIRNIFCLFKISYNDYFQVQFSYSIFYAIFGYLLKNTEFSTRSKKIIYILSILGLVYRYVVTFILSKKYGYVDERINGYDTWYCILQSMSIFLIFKDINFDKMSEKFKITMKKVSSCSFGIYLIHMIVVYYLIKLFNINANSWTYRTFGIIAVYMLSLIIVSIMKKIPILKKFVP